MSPSRLAASLVLGSLSACPAPEVTTPPERASEDVSNPASERESPRGVYLAIDDRVVRLGEAGEFETIAHAVDARALLTSPAGRLLALGEAGLLALGDDGFTVQTGFDAGLGEVEQIAFTSAGLWAIGSAAIGRAHDDRWELGPKLGREVVGFASAPRGELFVLADEHVWRFAGPDPLAELALALPFGHARELALTDAGVVAVAGTTCELGLIDPADPSRSWTRGREPSYGCEYPTALAIDGSARVWVGSLSGVHVLDASGVVAAYPSGSVPELVGALRSIAVVGGGPSELPEPGPVRTGGIAGKLEFRGKPVAHAQLEICPRPAPLFHATPCDNSPLRFATKTQADGSFAFEAVPLARYGWALQIGEQWTTTPAESVSGAMREGGVLDLGVQRLE
ncbi:hypothetical protein ACNOYE_23590 [Nannocystaceae bacterium ST9]